MAQDTKIQWCDSTCNPTMGCDGCELWNAKRKTCYAGILHRMRGGKKGYAPTFEEVTEFPGRMAVSARWSDLLGHERPAKKKYPAKPWLNGLPRLIFVSDMSDSLSKIVSFEYLKQEIIDVVTSEKGRRHQWLWLTKVPQRMAKFSNWLDQDWPENLWAGTSITTQRTTSRIKHLLRVGNDETIRFLSVEPQVGEIDLTEWLPQLDWVIHGGESGHDCREFRIEWAIDLIKQCRQLRVPYFLKQLGSLVTRKGEPVEFADSHAGEWDEWPKQVKVRQMPRVPKKRTEKASAKNSPKSRKVSGTKKTQVTEKKPSRSAPAVGDPLLDEFQKRCQGVCDLVHHVYHNEDVTGFYLWGSRGCGKTTGISRALENLGVTPVRFRGTSTAEGLFEAAKDSPDSVLWFNDDPRLLTESAAQQYLLAMLEGSIDPKTGEERRIITKARAKSTTGSQQFEFTGKLIFDSNVPVGNKPILQAVEDRMVVNNFSPHDSELAAVLLYLARLEEQDPGDQYTLIRQNDRDWKYWEKTTVKEREEVAQYIIDESTVHKRPLTLRILRDTLRYFVDQRDRDLQTDWRDVVIKEITQFDVQYRHTEAPSRKDRLDSEREELKAILEDAEDLGGTLEKNQAQEMWMEATGRNQRQFFRRLRELPENIRAIYESLPDARMSK